jgi:hypothetical protein
MPSSYFADTDTRKRLMMALRINPRPSGGAGTDRDENEP